MLQGRTQLTRFHKTHLLIKNYCNSRIPKKKKNSQSRLGAAALGPIIFFPHGTDNIRYREIYTEEDDA